jgi:hypothetical protein
LRASSPVASATTSPTATPAAITPSVCAAIAATVQAPAKILPRAVVAAAGGIVLRGIVTGREVLRRGGVRIRLAFLSCFAVVLFRWSGRKRVVVLLEVVDFRGVHFLAGSVQLFHVVSIVMGKLFVVRFFVMLRGACQGFAWEHCDRRTVRCG